MILPPDGERPISQATIDNLQRDRSGVSWPWILSAGLVTIALAIPFFLVDVPPVLDYPNHLARYFVLAHADDPVVSQMYVPRWAILPNLGMDVIGAALLRVIDADVGGRLLLAVSLLAPVVGVVVYHRTVFREYSYWPLASGLVAYNAAFFLGFMNFLLSLGLALMAGAIWIELHRRNMALMRICCGALAASAIFFCHIFGVAFFALLTGAYDASLLWKRLGSGSVAAMDILRTLGTTGAALSPALALYLLSPLGAGDASVGEWMGFAKLWRILAPFMTTDAELTLATGVVVVSLLVLFRRRIEPAPGLLFGLAGLLLAFAVAPSTVKGGTFVDLRFALMIGLLLFAGINPRLTGREAAVAGISVGLLIALRSVQVGMAWFEHRHDLAELRTAIAEVSPGQRVLATRGRPGHLANAEPAGRVLPGVYRLDGHLAALLVSERRAFWPLLFADPAQQPLAVKPPFDQIAKPLSEPAEWEWLTDGLLPPEALQRAPYLDHWQRNFDYVLLIDPPAALRSHPGLSPLYRGSYAQLYRVDRRASEARSPLRDARGSIGKITDERGSISSPDARP